MTSTIINDMWLKVESWARCIVLLVSSIFTVAMVYAGESLNRGGRHGVGRWMQPSSVQVVLNLHAQRYIQVIQDDEGCARRARYCDQMTRA